MKKLLVLGAGYASLAFLRQLPKKIFSDFEVTLVSKCDYHYVSVLLHEVAAGVESNICYPIKEILPCGAKFVCDEILEVKKDQAVGKNASYDYDYLVVGLGFEMDDFGISGVREYAYSLVDFSTASRLKNEIAKKLKELAEGKKENLNIVVCGAGFSGIELISSLSEELSLQAKKLNIQRERIFLTSIEAMPNILPMFKERLANRAMDILESMGIKMMLSSKILRLGPNSLTINKENKEQEILSDISIWTAGVKGSSVIEKSGFFVSTRSKVAVSKYLQPINQACDMQNIYVIGDCAGLMDEVTGRFYPPTAQMSIKMGEYLALAFEARIYGGNIKPFSYKSSGTVCSLGSNDAIGEVGKKEIRGRAAMILKRLIEKKWLYKLFGFLGIFKQ